MKTRTLVSYISLLVCALPLLGAAQGIPYATLRAVQDCADEARQIDGVVAAATLKHSNPGDTRGFQVFLETPRGRSEIKVLKDGAFRLPPLPKEDQDRARVTHSLEKSALTWALKLDLNGQLPDARIKEQNLFVMCSPVVDHFKKIDHVFDTLGTAVPELRDFQIAAVGISFPRKEPSSGRVFLKNGSTTVASIDLSQTGPVVWMFDAYDPKTHTLVLEMKNDAPHPPACLVFKFGKEIEGAKGAIFIRKVDQAVQRTGASRLAHR